MKKLFLPAIIITVMIGCNSSETNDSDASKSNAAVADSIPAEILNAPAEPAAADSTDNKLTEAEIKEGFKLLFDGKTKSGFHVFNNKTDGSAWKVVEGTFHLEPMEQHDAQTTGGGDQLTTEEYRNFHLKLDWRIDTAGNSGILLFVKELPTYERTWHTGLEMQVLDNARHNDAKIIKHRAGDLYDLITGSPESVKPALQWNHVEVISKDGLLEFTLNGTKVVSTQLWTEDWEKMVAGSKFAKWKDFGTFKSGKIGLQDHGNKVWYKNIKIKAL